jgi:hypothetical protein
MASGKPMDLLYGLAQMAIRFMLLVKHPVAVVVRPARFLRLLEEQEPVLALKVFLRLRVFLELNHQRKVLGAASA